MALVKLGGLAQDVRGSLNGNVFSRNRGGAYVRAKVSPVQPQTSFQNAVRAIFKGVAQLWATGLSAGQRAAWEAFAAIHPFINVFGDSIILSGVAMFEAINARRAMIGESYNLNPPDTFSVEDLGGVTLVCTYAGGILTLTVTPGRALLAHEKLFIYGTAPLAAGRAVQRADLKLINLVDLEGYTSGADVGPDLQERVPDVPFDVGDRLAVRVAAINDLTGAISVGITAEVVIAAP